MKYSLDNIFAKILRKEIQANIVYEDEIVLAFRDINPIRKVHVLVIPKKPYIDYNDFIANASENEIITYYKLIRKIAIEVLELETEGFTILCNNGEKSGQTVLHFHTHILSDKNF